MKRILLLLIILPTFALAQGEANWWTFGRNAAVNFNTFPPSTTANSQLFTFEGCSTISDECGNLLFYSDGSTVWDQNDNNKIDNNTELFGTVETEGFQELSLLASKNDAIASSLDTYFVSVT